MSQAPLAFAVAEPICTVPSNILTALPAFAAPDKVRTDALVRPSPAVPLSGENNVIVGFGSLMAPRSGGGGSAANFAVLPEKKLIVSQFVDSSTQLLIPAPGLFEKSLTYPADASRHQSDPALATRCKVRIIYPHVHLDVDAVDRSGRIGSPRTRPEMVVL